MKKTFVTITAFNNNALAAKSFISFSGWKLCMSHNDHGFSRMLVELPAEVNPSAELSKAGIPICSVVNPVAL